MYLTTTKPPISVIRCLYIKTKLDGHLCVQIGARHPNLNMGYFKRLLKLETSSMYIAHAGC